jgi:hypothetical protein
MTLAAVDDRRWSSTNAGGDVVPAGSFLDVDFRAEFVGARFSIAFPSPPALVLQTPLTGVTIAAREVVDGDGNGLGTVMVTAGADAESDPQYKARCESRWGTLAWAGPALSYDAWAREASDAVRRVFVDDTNPDGPGTVTIYVGGDAGPVGGDDVTAVDDVLQVRKPPCAIVTTSNVTATTLTLVAVLECPAGQQTATRAAIYDALATELRELSIGDGVSKGKFRYHRLEKFILDALPDAGDIDTLTVNGGTSNVIPAKGHVFLVDGAVLDPALAWLSFA